MLDCISTGPFQDYTLHNRDHAKKLVHLSEYIIGIDNIDKLSVLDIAVIILSAYIHDIGMCLANDDRLRILNSDEFRQTIQRWPGLNKDIKETEINLQQCEGTDKQSYLNRLFQLQEEVPPF